jgi:hypothetical protein
VFTLNEVMVCGVRYTTVGYCFALFDRMAYPKWREFDDRILQQMSSLLSLFAGIKNGSFYH